jgi:hypothetical protein
MGDAFVSETDSLAETEEIEEEEFSDYDSDDDESEASLSVYQVSNLLI